MYIIVIDYVLINMHNNFNWLYYMLPSVIMVCTVASGTLALIAVKNSKYADVSSVYVIAQTTGCSLKC